jgi:hypothetical protein
MSNNIAYSKKNDARTIFPHGFDNHILSQELSLNGNHSSLEALEEANHRLLFGPCPTTRLTNDVTMTNHPTSVIVVDGEDTDEICSDLQSKFKLDPEHSKIALISSKIFLSLFFCALIPVNDIIAELVHLAILHNSSPQRQGMPTWYLIMLLTISLVRPRSLDLLLTSTMNNSGSVVFLCLLRVDRVYNVHFRHIDHQCFILTLQEFVRMKAWIFLLIPGLEEYSNNPHKNGALAKTLYYLSLVSHSNFNSCAVVQSTCLPLPT